MQRLTGLDAFLLYLETPTQPLNVCCVLQLDTSTMPGGYSYTRFRAALAKRVKLVPEFRVKLADSQLNLDHPVWVDDANFQLRRHLHRVAMPPPGGHRELAEVCGHIAGLPLERDRPLWEMWVIEGGAGADSLAVMLKVHHAVVDGVSGVNLLNHLCGVEPELPPLQPRDGAGGAYPFQIAASGLVGFALRPWRLTTVLPATVRTLVQTALRARQGRTMAAPFAAPPTAFNAPFTERRNIAFTQLDLRDIKAIKNRHGLTVNDVVVGLCAGALRRFLLDRGSCRTRRCWLRCRCRCATSLIDPGETSSRGCSADSKATSVIPPSDYAISSRETLPRKITPRRWDPPCRRTGPSSAARRCSERPCASCRVSH
jgi:WS/DGAT/MGAT family acyltransferase